MRTLPLLLALAACARAPFTPTTFSVKVSGHGRPVIFVPGMATPGTIWDDTVAHLGAGVQAHVLTIAGFGGQPPVRARPLLRAVRDELARYLRERKLRRPILVGHSLGGAICWWLTATHPDLVAGMVAVDVPPYGVALEDPDVTATAFAPRARQMADQMRNAPRAAAAAAARAKLATLITDPKTAARWADRAAQSDFPTVADALYELLTLDLREEAARIRVPVLVLVAKNDVPPDAWAAYEKNWHRQIDRIASARMRVLPGRHYLMLDAPDAFFAALGRFIAATP